MMRGILVLLLVLPTHILLCGCSSGRRVPDARPAPVQQVKASPVAPVASSPEAAFSVMTFNLRSFNEKDSLAGRGWDVRKHLIVQLIRELQPDVLAVQELTDVEQNKPVGWFREQMGDVALGKADGYTAVLGTGVSPEDIYFNSARFEVIRPERASDENSRHFGGCGYGRIQDGCTAEVPNSFYLPPDRISPCRIELNGVVKVGTGRAATWAIVRDRVSNGEYFVINSHFYHSHKHPDGDRVRREQARCIVEQAAVLSAGRPVIVMGDFNMKPQDPIIASLAEGMGEADRALSDTHFNAEGGTFNGFCEDCKPASKLDYIFERGFTVVGESAIIQKRFNGMWPSDHCPVMVTIQPD